MRAKIVLAAALNAILWLVNSSGAESRTGRSDAPYRLKPVDVRSVCIGGEIGRRIDATIRNNLLQLNVDDHFLRPFEQKKAKAGYIGIGKLLDSSVLLAAHTNDPQVAALRDRLARALIEAQQDDGYIGMMAPEHRMWKHWDVHEMAYIIFALVNDYQYHGQRESLEAAAKTADYIISHWHSMPIDWIPAKAIELSTIGLQRAMLALSEATGDQRYLNFSTSTCGLADWNLPIELGRQRRRAGHAYAYMTRCVAQLELYGIHPDDKLTAQSRGVMDFLLEQDGLVLTGACSQHECWHNDQQVSGDLGETCATAYLIRLLDHLMRLENDPRYGDVMERTIYNALFATQSPDGRKIRYYSPLEGKRVYFDRDTYCCPNNYRRIIAELPSKVYYRDDEGLTVNLFTSSTATLNLAGGLSLSMRQETDYPSSGKVTIQLDPSKAAQFTLRLRIPRWCDQARIAVNGEQLDEVIRREAFHAITRQWKPGDEVELIMPMPWRLVRGRKQQSGRVAVMRGPVVFCLNPQRHEGLAQMQLSKIVMDPSTIQGPIKDESIRPYGISCEVRAWSPAADKTRAPDLLLKLTEFPDPQGEATYFSVKSDTDIGVSDELIELACSKRP